MAMAYDNDMITTKKERAVDWGHNDRYGHSHFAAGCPGQEKCQREMKVTSPHP